jgi:tape measure domain-containing protein
MADFGTIGTARVKLVVDTSKLEKDLKRALAKAQKQVKTAGLNLGVGVTGGPRRRGRVGALAGISGARSANLNLGVPNIPTASFDRLKTAIAGIGTSMRRSTAVLQRSFRTIRNSLGAVTASVFSLKTGLAALGTGIVLGGFLRAGDALNNLNSRLQIVAKSTEDFAESQMLVRDIAQETFTPLAQVTQLYVRLQLAGKQLGLTTLQTAEIMEGLGKAIQISGSTAAEAAGTILQFTQAIAGNFSASAQEFNSILEQSPRLAAALADGLNELGFSLADVGKEGLITTGNLKQLGEKGIIDSLDVLRALQTQLGTLREEFSKLPLTIARAFQRLKNSFLLAAGGANIAGSASEEFAKGLEEVRKIVESPGFQQGLKVFAENLAAIFKFAATKIQDFGISQFKVGITPEIAKQIEKIEERIESLRGSLKKLDQVRDVLQSPFTTEDQQQRIFEALGVDSFDAAIKRLRTQSQEFKDEINALKEEIVKVSTEIEGEVSKTRPAAAPIPGGKERKGLTKSQTDAQKSVAALVDALRDEIRVLEADAAAREALQIEIQAENILRKEGLSLSTKTRAEIRALVSEKRELETIDLAKQLTLENEVFKQLLNTMPRTTDEFEKLSRAAEIEVEIIRSGIPVHGAAANAFRKAAKGADELDKALEELGESVAANENINEQIRLNSELIKAYRMSVKEGELVAKMQELIKDGFKGTNAELKANAQLLLDQERVLAELMDTTNPLKEAFQELGATFSSAFEDAIVEAEKLDEILNALFKDIFRIAIRKLATEPLFGALAKGFETGDLAGAFGEAQKISILPGGPLIGGGKEEEKIGRLSEETKAGLEALSKGSQRAQESLAETATAGKRASAILGENLAEGSLKAATATVTETSAIGSATSGLVAFTAALAKATAQLNLLGGGGTLAGGGGGTPGRFGGGFPLQQLASGFFTTTGRAAGGLVVGPGTGKSDSILSSLSNGEFVVNSQATSQNLPALEAINNGERLQQGDMVFNIDGAQNPEAVAAEVAAILSSQISTPRQSTRQMVRQMRRSQGDGF